MNNEQIQDLRDLKNHILSKIENLKFLDNDEYLNQKLLLQKINSMLINIPQLELSNLNVNEYLHTDETALHSVDLTLDNECKYNTAGNDTNNLIDSFTKIEDINKIKSARAREDFSAININNFNLMLLLLD